MNLTKELLAQLTAGQLLSSSARVVAVSGQYGAMQIWNPAGSNKRVVILSARASIAAAGAVAGTLNDAAQLGLTARSAWNLKTQIGGVATAQQGALASLPAYSPLRDHVMNAAGIAEVINAPVVIAAGKGCSLVCLTANVTCSFDFTWIEA